jgi:hypothetical protein
MKRDKADAVLFPTIIEANGAKLDWLPIDGPWSMSERECLEEMADAAEEACRTLEDLREDETK